MHNFTKLPALLALVAGLAVTIPAASGIAAPTVAVDVTSGLISGRVITASGDVLSGAQVAVIITGSTETVISTRTQADGSYKLSVPNLPGVYTLRVLSVGYSPVSIALVRENNAWNVPADITMRPIAADPVGVTP